MPGPLAIGSYPYRVNVIDQYGDISSPSRRPDDHRGQFPDPHTDTQSDTDTHADARSDSDPHTNAQSDTGTHTNAQSDTGTHTNAQSDTDPHSNANSDRSHRGTIALSARAQQEGQVRWQAGPVRFHARLPRPAQFRVRLQRRQLPARHHHHQEG